MLGSDALEVVGSDILGDLRTEYTCRVQLLQTRKNLAHVNSTACRTRGLGWGRHGNFIGRLRSLDNGRSGDRRMNLLLSLHNAVFPCTTILILTTTFADFTMTIALVMNQLVAFRAVETKIIHIVFLDGMETDITETTCTVVLLALLTTSHRFTTDHCLFPSAVERNLRLTASTLLTGKADERIIIGG